MITWGWIVRQLDYDLTPVAGLALVGHMREAMRPVLSRIDTALPLKGGVANNDIVRSYLGLLTQGACSPKARAISTRSRISVAMPSSRRQIQTGAHMGQGCDLTAAMFVRKLSIQHGLPIN